MADLNQCTTSIAATNKWRMTNQPHPRLQQQRKETTIALTLHTNTQLIKRHKTRGANNEMNGEMRKNCLKGGGGGEISLNHPELTFRSQFSISGYK